MSEEHEHRWSDWRIPEVQACPCGRIRTRLDAVRDLHKNAFGVCGECESGGESDNWASPVLWPCTTARLVYTEQEITAATTSA